MVVIIYNHQWANSAKSWLVRSYNQDFLGRRKYRGFSRLLGVMPISKGGIMRAILFVFFFIGIVIGYIGILEGMPGQIVAGILICGVSVVLERITKE